MSRHCWFGAGSVVITRRILTNPRLIRWRGFTTSGVEKLDQYQSGKKAADVGRISDTALLRAAAQHPQSANQLKREPDSNRDVSRHLCEKAEENHSHAPFWMQQKITAQHSRDCSRRAKTRNLDAARIKN